MEKDIFFMKGKYSFDENIYPTSWRFNSSDCILSPEEKSKIVFFNKIDSERIWDSIFPFYILMDIQPSQCEIINKLKLDFNNPKESAAFFHRNLDGFPEVFFFWGRRSAAFITSSEIIKNAWDDFFYPNDESSIIYIPNTKIIIFSYEENFFHAKMIK